MRGYDPRSVLLFKDSSGLWIDPGWGLLFSQITLQPLSKALQWRLKTSDSDLWSTPLNAEREGRNPLFPSRATVESAWYSSRPCSPRSELRTRQRIASWSGGVLQMTSDLPPAWGDLNSGTPLKLPVPKPNPFFFFFSFFSPSYQEDLPPSAYQDGDLCRANNLHLDSVVLLAVLSVAGEGERGQSYILSFARCSPDTVKSRRSPRLSPVYISLSDAGDSGREMTLWVLVWYFGCGYGWGEETLCTAKLKYPVFWHF